MKMFVTVLSVCLLAAGCGKSKTKTNDKTGGGKTGNANKGKADWPPEEFKGKNPVMVVVIGSKSSQWYTKFFDQWQSVAAEAKKHNLVVMEVFFNNDNQSGGIRGGRSFSLREARNMYDAFSMGPNTLAVTVLGKDGKLIKKLRYPKSPQEAIDLLKN